jgi:alkanesulfonate monooxygenase SsuD/methylene tetrahydromethanopterin reductase-like flavin-dependent oxidoreductase (luciferase family)
MEFGLGLLGYSQAWEDVRFAGAHGFTRAGFVDSPLLGGDPFVCLGLAAQATTRIRIEEKLMSLVGEHTPVGSHA